VFDSDTDTEVIAHLVELYQREDDNLLAATQRALPRLRGTYALVLMSSREPR